jgi:hypothetical protein
VSAQLPRYLVVGKGHKSNYEIFTAVSVPEEDSVDCVWLYGNWPHKSRLRWKHYIKMNLKERLYVKWL